MRFWQKAYLNSPPFAQFNSAEPLCTSNIVSVSQVQVFGMRTSCMQLYMRKIKVTVLTTFQIARYIFLLVEEIIAK